MPNKNRVHLITMTALLCAIGIIIPMVFPRIPLPPASFTLASHVPVFLAVFLSPVSALAVSLGTTLGFFLTGIPLPIVLRALSHVVFALVGAFWLRANPTMLQKPASSILFCAVLSIIHAVCEVLIILPLYFGNLLDTAVYENGFFYYIILLVGVGTFVHSCIDFAIAVAVWKPVSALFSRTGAGAPAARE